MVMSVHRLASLVTASSILSLLIAGHCWPSVTSLVSLSTTDDVDDDVSKVEAAGVFSATATTIGQSYRWQNSTPLIPHSQTETSHRMHRESRTYINNVIYQSPISSSVSLTMLFHPEIIIHFTVRLRLSVACMLLFYSLHGLPCVQNFSSSPTATSIVFNYVLCTHRTL